MTKIKEMLIMLPFKFNEHGFWNDAWVELLVDYEKEYYSPMAVILKPLVHLVDVFLLKS